jgi:hypothetical protein
LDYNITHEKFDNAKQLLDDEAQYGQIILSNYSDVIRDVVMKHLTPDNYLCKPLVYEACEYILKMFAEKCHQQGILFEFLEMLENCKDDDIFRSILKSLQVILLKQSESKTRSLEYVLNSIEDYVLDLELPELLKKKYLDEQEMKFLENDSNVQRILMTYITLDLFYSPIVDQIVNTSIANIESNVNVFRSAKYTRQNVLFCFILRLLGKPLSYLDLSLDATNANAKSYAREIAEKLVATLCRLHTNVYSLLQYVEMRCRWPLKGKIDEDLENIFLHPEKMPLSQSSILFYLIIAEGIAYESLPKVYSPTYIFCAGLYLVNNMLTSNETIISKGLKLCEKMLKNAASETLSSDYLDVDIFRDFCNNLIKMLIYSASKENRQQGLVVLRMFIYKFDIHGRIALIKNIMNVSSHKGLIGYLITMYKDIIFENINNIGEFPACLSGYNFKSLILNHICKLENGVQCDISESSDQIIASLNFLIAMLQRDKDNKTGIKSMTIELEKGYLTELRSALDFSRAHFKEEAERVKKNDNAKDATENKNMMNLEILNDIEQPLDELTKDKKLEMLKSALVVFDLIDYHLARVNEIINRSM